MSKRKIIAILGVVMLALAVCICVFFYSNSKNNIEENKQEEQQIQEETQKEEDEIIWENPVNEDNVGKIDTDKVEGYEILKSEFSDEQLKIWNQVCTRQLNMLAKNVSQVKIIVSNIKNTAKTDTNTILLRYVKFDDVWYVCEFVLDDKNIVNIRALGNEKVVGVNATQEEFNENMPTDVVEGEY